MPVAFTSTLPVMTTVVVPSTRSNALAPSSVYTPPVTTWTTDPPFKVTTGAVTSGTTTTGLLTTTVRVSGVPTFPARSVAV